MHRRASGGPEPEYCTSPPERDWPWLMGLFRRTDIKMVRLHLPSLEALAPARRPA